MDMSKFKKKEIVTEKDRKWQIDLQVHKKVQERERDNKAHM